MRVIHIVHGRCNPEGHNGISRVVYYLNKYEKLNGINSEIWGLVDNTKNHYTYKRDEFVTVECFPRMKTPLSKKEILKKVEDEIDSIDLVHFHMIWFYDKNIIAKKLNDLNIPYVITTHGTYSNPHAYTGKRLLVKYLYELKYLQNATEIHTITREEGTGLLKYGYDGKSFLGYNGIDINQIPQNLKSDFFRSKTYHEKIKFGWIGVFRKDKNLESLIKSVSNLSSELRDKIVFILVGPDYKNNAKKYLDLAEKLGCIDNFDWIGPLYGKEKYEAVSSFDVYVMPSFSEGFSLSILDAMACGKPCLLTRGCNMNYFNSHENEFFVSCEPYPQDLARGIVEMISRRNEWSQLGLNAKRLVESKFNWDTIAREIISDYHRIVEGETNVGR